MRALAVLGALAVVCSSAAARPLDGADRDINGRLVFSVTDLEDINGDAQLVVSDPDGRRRQVVLGSHDGAGSYLGAAWSPDGEKIAVSLYQSDRYTGNWSSRLFVAHPDGTGYRQIADDLNLEEGSPAWSPDESHLAYVTRTREGASEIRVARTDGTRARALVQGESPTWSPDSARIAFTRSNELFIVELETSRVTRLTQGVTPDWGAGGIVFGRRGTIWLVRLSATVERRLASGATPVWSPDGRKIAFTRRGDIHVMNRDGSGVRNVTRTPSMSRDEEDPDWQPVPVVNGTIHGSRFDDYLAGWQGNQRIEGQAGDDVLAGGRGRDLLDGGPGNDTFFSQDRERDILVGGSGRDRAAADRRDRVRGVERVSTR